MNAQTSSVQVTLGWDGWIRFGTWNPVTVHVEVDRPVRGWVVVEVPQEFGAQRVRLRHPVDLPAGGRWTWRVPVHLVDPRRPVRASVVAQDGTEVASSETVPLPEGAVASVVGYIGPRAPLPPAQAAGGGRRAVVRLREEWLPEGPAAYASLDLLVLGELDERRLNHAQQRALQTWVLHGGRVVVAGWFPPTAPLSGWLSPAQDAGAGGEASGLRSVSDGPLRELVPRPGGHPVVERSHTVAVWAPRGLGRVYAWAADADRVPPSSPLWYLALPQPGSTGGPPPDPDWAVRAPVGPVAVGLGAYAVLWVLALALAGRSRWGWPAVAVLVAGSWVWVPVLAEEVRGRSVFWDVTRVEFTVEGVGRVYGWAFAQVPYAGTYTYTLPAATALAASGGFAELDAAFFEDRVQVGARQAAGDRLRLHWEAEGSAGAPTLEQRGGTVVVTGAAAEEGVVLWRGQEAPLERSGRPDEWVASRWRPAGRQHPALAALGWVRPDLGSIVEDRPVVVLPVSDGWQVVVGPDR